MGRFIQIFAFSVLFGTLGLFAIIVGGWLVSEQPTEALHTYLEGGRQIDVVGVSVTRGDATVCCDDRAFIKELLIRMKVAERLLPDRMPDDAFAVTFTLGSGGMTTVYGTWSADTNALVIAVPKIEPEEFAVPGYAKRDRFAITLDGDLPEGGKPVLELIKRPAAAPPA